MLSAAAVMATACEVEPKDLFSTEPVAPVLASHNAVLLNGAASNEDVTFSWSAARNVSGDVVYSLELSYDGNDAALVSTDQLYYTTTKEALWTLLLGMGAPEHQMFSFSLQVTASGDFEDLVSESVAVQAYINEEDVAPVLTVCPEGEVFEKATAKETLAFAWTPAFIGAGEGITYSLYVHTAPLNDAGAATSVLAEELTDTTYEMTKGDLNKAMLGLGIEADVATDLYFTVAAVSGSYPDGLYSESKVANFTAYVSAAVGWSLIGVNGDWDNDIDMTFVDNGLWISSIINISGEFKLRFAHDWGVNRGGNGLAEGVTINVENNGPNMSLTEGSYYIVYNEVDETVSAYASWKGWGLIGDALPNGWDGDSFKMLEVKTGVFKTAFVVGAGQFKMRYDNAWTDKDTYCDFTDYKVPAAAQHGGNNIQIPDSDIEIVVTYDTNNETVVIEQASARNMADHWGVIGVGGDWDNDVYMYQVDATTWRSVPFVVSDEFKLRFGGGWGTERAGGFEELGKPFACPNGNGNIYGLADIVGEVVCLVYDSANETITIDNVK